MVFSADALPVAPSSTPIYRVVRPPLRLRWSEAAYRSAVTVDDHRRYDGPSSRPLAATSATGAGLERVNTTRAIVTVGAVLVSLSPAGLWPTVVPPRVVSLHGPIALRDWAAHKLHHSPSAEAESGGRRREAARPVVAELDQPVICDQVPHSGVGMFAVKSPHVNGWYDP